MKEKGNADDIRALAEDLTECMRKHPDALRNNPDLAEQITRVRDNTYDCYYKLAELV